MGVKWAPQKGDGTCGSESGGGEENQDLHPLQQPVPWKGAVAREAPLGSVPMVSDSPQRKGRSEGRGGMASDPAAKTSPWVSEWWPLAGAGGTLAGAGWGSGDQR